MLKASHPVSDCKRCLPPLASHPAECVRSTSLKAG